MKKRVNKRYAISGVYCDADGFNKMMFYSEVNTWSPQLENAVIFDSLDDANASIINLLESRSEGNTTVAELSEKTNLSLLEQAKLSEYLNVGDNNDKYILTHLTSLFILELNSQNENISIKQINPLNQFDFDTINGKHKEHNTIFDECLMGNTSIETDESAYFIIGMCNSYSDVTLFYNAPKNENAGSIGNFSNNIEDATKFYKYDDADSSLHKLINALLDVKLSSIKFSEYQFFIKSIEKSTICITKYFDENDKYKKLFKDNENKKIKEDLQNSILKYCDAFIESNSENSKDMTRFIDKVISTIERSYKTN